MQDPSSTLSDVSAESDLVVGMWLRRGALVLLAVVVVVALFGLLGVHTRTVTASGKGLTLTVQYAGIARPGLDVPFRVTVASQVELPSQITVAVSREYLAMFETQGFHPEPSESTSHGDDVLLTFDIPDGQTTLVVDYDAYVQPSTQRGEDAQIQVLDDDLVPQIAVSFRTSLFP